MAVFWAEHNSNQSECRLEFTLCARCTTYLTYPDNISVGVSYPVSYLDFVGGPLAVNAGLVIWVHVSMVGIGQDVPLLEFR